MKLLRNSPVFHAKWGITKPKILCWAKSGLELSCQPLRPAIFGRFGLKTLSDINQGGFEPKTRHTDKNWGLQDQNLIFGFSALVKV